GTLAPLSLPVRAALPTLGWRGDGSRFSRREPRAAPLHRDTTGVLRRVSGGGMMNCTRCHRTHTPDYSLTVTEHGLLCPVCINLSIGAIIVYVCAEHFAQFLQRSPVPHGELSREDVPLSVDPHDYPLVDERKPA